MKRIFFQQRPAEMVTILFLLSLLAIIFLHHQVLPRFLYLTGLYSGLLIAQFLLIKLQDKNNFFRISYDIVFPTICVLAIFDSLEWLVHYVNPQDIDPLLIKLDYLLFKNHPTVMLERFINPLLTDLLQIAYSTYYFIPLSFGILLLLNRQKEDFNKSLFFVLFCFYLSYLGYILFPALGPRFYLDHLQTTELRGYIIAEPIQDLLNRLEGIKRDAFPSGHTGVVLTVLYLSFRYKRNFFWTVLPIATALIFSTVYCRYHYVVDVIAGFVLMFVTVLFGELYYGWWTKSRRVSQDITLTK